MVNWYLLKGKEIVKATDIMAVEAFLKSPEKIIRQTEIGKVKVSTSFLCLDHSFCFGSPTPILFETMIFGGEHDRWQQRYATYDQAIRGHQVAVELVRESVKQ